MLQALRQMAEGQPEGLDEFFRLCGDAMFSFACRALPSRADAEEVLQDALVRIWNKAANYDPVRSKPFTWAMMILRGLVYDRLRHQRRRVTLEALPDINDAYWPASVGPLLGGERLDWEAAWASLNEHERGTLELAIFTAATAEEIASMRQEPVGTVKTRIRRGMQKLRDILYPSTAP